MIWAVGFNRRLHFKEMTWRHLNFFQHHCYITASVPRVRCPEHKVKQVDVPWARKGSSFTLLVEQAAMLLVREMPVMTTANLLEMNDKRLWRIVLHYVKTAMCLGSAGIGQSSRL